MPYREKFHKGFFEFFLAAEAARFYGGFCRNRVIFFSRGLPRPRASC